MPVVSLGIVASGVKMEPQVRLPGGAVTNSVFATPDHAGFAMGDFTLEWYGSIDDTTTTDVALISQWAPTANRAFSLRWANIGGVKQFKLWISLTGTTSLTAVDGSFPFTLANDQFFGVRATRQSSTGTMKVYTSPTVYSPTWTLRGTSTPASATGTLFNSTDRVMVGGIGTATAGVTSNHVVGNFRYGRVYNGYEAAGTLIAAPDPALALRLDDASITDATGKVWTPTGAASFIAMPRAA